ncbi:Hypothetical protein GQ85_005 [Rhodococcus rhodochrous]|nr:hypothetical protein [Rhodococcus rhodochrous]OOL33109.1 Hypothetical protein GQ85_005 [Rhodococcus rhodochrous]
MRASSAAAIEVAATTSQSSGTSAVVVSSDSTARWAASRAGLGICAPHAVTQRLNEAGLRCRTDTKDTAAESEPAGHQRLAGVPDDLDVGVDVAVDHPVGQARGEHQHTLIDGLADCRIGIELHDVATFDEAEARDVRGQEDVGAELVVAADANERAHPNRGSSVDGDGDCRLVRDEQRGRQDRQSVDVRAERVGARAVPPAAGKGCLHDKEHDFSNGKVSGRHSWR